MAYILAKSDMACVRHAPGMVLDNGRSCVPPNAHLYAHEAHDKGTYRYVWKKQFPPTHTTKLLQLVAVPRRRSASPLSHTLG